MWIGFGNQPSELWPETVFPALPVGDEKSLVGGPAVDGRGSRLARERFVVGGVSHDEAAQIGNAFPFDQFPLYVQTRLDFEFIELLGDTVAAFVEIPQIGVRPPILQIAPRVELWAR